MQRVTLYTRVGGSLCSGWGVHGVSLAARGYGSAAAVGHSHQGPHLTAPESWESLERSQGLLSLNRQRIETTKGLRRDMAQTSLPYATLLDEAQATVDPTNPTGPQADRKEALGNSPG